WVGEWAVAYHAHRRKQGVDKKAADLPHCWRNSRCCLPSSRRAQAAFNRCWVSPLTTPCTRLRNAHASAERTSFATAPCNGQTECTKKGRWLSITRTAKNDTICGDRP